MVINVTVHLSHKIENFYSIESFGIEYKHVVQTCVVAAIVENVIQEVKKNRTLKEEREYHLIDKYMTYIWEEKKSEAGHP